MLKEGMDPPEQLPSDLRQEGISSPIAAEILRFCDEGNLFSETLRSSDVSSCSGGGGSGGAGDICCYDDGSLSSDFPPFSSIDASTISELLDSQPQLESQNQPDIILSRNLSPLPAAPPLPPGAAVFPNHRFISNPQSNFNPSITDIAAPIGGYSSFPSDSLIPLSSVSLPLVPQTLSSVFDDDGVLPLPGFMGLDSSASTSCSFIDPTMAGSFYGGSMSISIAGDRPAFYPVAMAQEAAQDSVTDYQGFYAPDGAPHQRIFCGSGESQKLFGDGVSLVSGCASPTPLSSDVPSLDESSFKVGRLSVEERREKIHRYMKKRNERNFSKKIKYACRKTLADSRPRVRGRFAKNDEFGDATRTGSGNHEDDDDEDVAMKEEDDAIVSSELFAHLGAMNSFKCNYTLESWI